MTLKEVATLRRRDWLVQGVGSSAALGGKCYGSFEKLCNTTPEEQALQQRGISRHRFKLRLS